MAEVTETQIAEWKQKYGTVKRIWVDRLSTVNAPGDPKPKLAAYVRIPDKSVLAAAAPFAQSDPMRAQDIFYTNCYLGGDEELATRDEYRVALATAIGSLFVIPATSVEEL